MNYMIMEPETPKELSAAEKKIAENIHAVLGHLGEDPNRQGLLKTPERVAKAYTFITQGYQQDARRILRSAMFDEDYSEMVLVKDIELYSLVSTTCCLSSVKRTLRTSLMARSSG